MARTKFPLDIHSSTSSAGNESPARGIFNFLQMRISSYFLSFMMIVLGCAKAFAQEQPSLLKRADMHYQRYEFAPAASIYERILAKQKRPKDSLIIMQKLADSHQQLNDYERAAYWYSHILKLEKAPPETYLYYGDLLKNLGKYEEAKQQYARFPGAGSDISVQRRIAGCDSAMAWSSTVPGVSIANEQILNSGRSDWGTVWYGKQLVFVSDSIRGDGSEIGGSRLDYRRNRHPYLKLYQADSTPVGLGYVQPFDEAFNSSKYHAGPVCFNRTRDTAYLTVTNASRKVMVEKDLRPGVYGQRRLEIMIYVKKNGKWKFDKPFPYNNVDSFSTGHPTLCPAGKMLYFTSDRPGGKGKTDIWFCEKREDGSWAPPQNAGDYINTPEEEAFPCMADDGTMYFASKGWPGLGGFDIFRVNGSGNQWWEPSNMRPPLNSSADDFFLILNNAGNGFLSSNREGGKGDDDIYSVRMPVLLRPNTVRELVKPDLVIDFTAQVCAPFDACVYLFNKKRNVGYCYMTHPPDGTIKTKLEVDTDYEIRVYWPGHSVHNVPFTTKGLHAGDALTKQICHQ
jgi:tetratricopeptide (TPR) repeat protein